MLINRDKLKNIILEDDETPYGGTSFSNETGADFCDSLENFLPDTWKKYGLIELKVLNANLKECSIKPVNIASLCKK